MSDETTPAGGSGAPADAPAEPAASGGERLVFAQSGTIGPHLWSKLDKLLQLLCFGLELCIAGRGRGRERRHQRIAGSHGFRTQSLQTGPEYVA